MNYASSGEVRVRVWSSGEHVHVAVTDKGPGIPEDQIEAIFKPHVRLTSDEPRAPRGSGLGLHIARLIIEAHGGELSVESKLGQGTTFTVSLPLVAQLTGSVPPG
jgi:signal transduction histidine kinase